MFLISLLTAKPYPEVLARNYEILPYFNEYLLSSQHSGDGHTTPMSRGAVVIVIK